MPWAYSRCLEVCALLSRAAAAWRRNASQEGRLSVTNVTGASPSGSVALSRGERAAAGFRGDRSERAAARGRCGDGASPTGRTAQRMRPIEVVA